MIQSKSVGGGTGLQALVLAAVLGSLVPWSAFAGIPLAEFLSSRAGRMIFSESLEGAIAANRILGTNVANPLTRMERLTEALADSRLSGSTAEVESRMNRMYQEFAAKNPKRAKELFRENATGESLLQLAEGDRRLLRDLVQREFNSAFISKLSATNYRMVEEQFLIEGAEGIRGVSASAPNMSPQERALVFWETQKNAVAARSAEMVKIEHFEIPTDLLVNDLATRMPQDLRDALIFKRGGKEYVRWLINPEDTKHYKAVEKFLKKNGLSAARKQHFEAY